MAEETSQELAETNGASPRVADPGGSRPHARGAAGIYASEGDRTIEGDPAEGDRPGSAALAAGPQQVRTPACSAAGARQSAPQTRTAQRAPVRRSDRDGAVG